METKKMASNITSMACNNTMTRLDSHSMDYHQIPLNPDMMKHSTFMDKALVREIMLQHEKTFKEQVHDLHKLYEIQRALMCNAKHGYTLAVGIDEAKRGPNKEANNSTRKKVIDLEQLPEDDSDDENGKPKEDVYGSHQGPTSHGNSMFSPNSNHSAHNHLPQHVQGPQLPPNLVERPLAFGGADIQSNTPMAIMPQPNHGGLMSQAIGKETHWFGQGCDGPGGTLGCPEDSCRKGLHDDLNLIYGTTSAMGVMKTNGQHNKHEVNVWYAQSNSVLPMLGQQVGIMNKNQLDPGWLSPPLQNATQQSVHPHQVVYGLPPNMDSLFGNYNSNGAQIGQNLIVQEPLKLGVNCSDGKGVNLKLMSPPQQSCKEEVEVKGGKTKDKEGRNMMAGHVTVSPAMQYDGKLGLKPSLQQPSVSGACLTNGALEVLNEEMLSGSCRKDDAIGSQTKKPHLSRHRQVSDLSASSQVTMQAVSMQSSCTEAPGNAIKQEPECSSDAFESNAISTKGSSSMMWKRKSDTMTWSDNDDTNYDDDHISDVDNLAASILLSFMPRPTPGKKGHVECSKLADGRSNKYKKLDANKGLKLSPRDRPEEFGPFDDGHQDLARIKEECGMKGRGVDLEAGRSGSKERTRRREPKNCMISKVVQVDVHTLPRGRRSSRGPLATGKAIHDGISAKEHLEHCDSDGDRCVEAMNPRRRKHFVEKPDKFERDVKDKVWKGADRKKSRSRQPVVHTPEVSYKKAHR